MEKLTGKGKLTRKVGNHPLVGRLKDENSKNHLYPQ